MSSAPDSLQTGYIYLYVERLGINSSLIRPHYELPIAMVASSRKKKSSHGITIRKNKQSESTTGGLTSHLNRTESSQSNNVGKTSNMIPCFPTNSDTDAYHSDTVSNRSSTSHLTKYIPSNISQVRTWSTTKKITPLLGKSVILRCYNT